MKRSVRVLRSVVAACCALVVVTLSPGIATAAPEPLAHTALPSCPSRVPAGTLWDGSGSVGVRQLCERAVAEAATPQAKIAIRAAFGMLGAPYACGDVGRSSRFRYDCSSLVSRAYLVAGIPAAGRNWSASTRDLMPWDGRKLAPWAAYLSPALIRPGDLVVYNTGAALSRHVVMYLGSGYMLHTNYCGGVAHVEKFWGFPTSGAHRFAVVRRVVVPPAGTPAPTDLTASAEAHATRVSYAKFAAHDRAATIRVQKALDDVASLGLLVDGRWDGGMWAAVVGFRRGVLGWSRDDAVAPLDRGTLRELGKRAGFTLTA